MTTKYMFLAIVAVIISFLIVQFIRSYRCKSAFEKGERNLPCIKTGNEFGKDKHTVGYFPFESDYVFI